MERTIKELLIILRDRIEEPDNIIKTENCGLCCVCYRLTYYHGKISHKEKGILLNYIERNRPKYKKNQEFGWKPGAAPSRLKWLNKKIKEL